MIRPMASAFAIMFLLSLALIPLAESFENSDILGGRSVPPSVQLEVSAAPIPLAEPFDNSAILAALSAPPIVHPEVQQLAQTFVSNTLPRLIKDKDDALLAKHLGFADAQSLNAFLESGAVLDTPLAIFVVHLQDIRDFVIERTPPIQIINNDINWIKDPDGRLLPMCLLFPIKVNIDAETDWHTSWSSVIIEKTPSTPWRVAQVGGPKLIRAVKRYATRNMADFVVWVPSINRHYLGHVAPAV